MNGVIIVNKPKGYTSHDIVNKLRKILKTKKIGHTGTLDPNATGVLPVLIGQATKISKYLIEHDKTYIAVLKLGEKTDTGDSEGKVIEKDNSNSTLKKEEIEKVLKSFLGKQKQKPPIYSSIKINGKKAYEYAREGTYIELPERNIEIYNIDLLGYSKNEITFSVNCSKGTYIRSLSEDIAKKLGTVGYTKELMRTSVDDFKIEEAYTLEEIEKSIDKIKIFSIEEIFKNIERIILDDKKIKLFLNGCLLSNNRIDGIYRIYNNENFIGIGIINNKLLKRDIIIV